MRPTTARVLARPRTLLLAATLFAMLTGSAPSPARPAASRVLDKNLAPKLAADAAAVPVIIRFASPPTAADRHALVKAGFVPPFIRYQVIPAVAATGPASAIRSLSQNPRVRYVELDAEIPYTLDRATQVARAKQTWSATYKDLGGVHTDGITGRGVGIAIVDSGIDATHPDLLWKPMAVAGRQAKTVANYKMIGRDSVGFTGIVDEFVEANTLAVDMPHTDNTGGHGTHVAGIAAGLGVASGGKYKGAAPGANLIGFGAGEALFIGLGLAAFDYIHQHHSDEELNIRIVSNSWGGPGDWDPESAVTIAARRLVSDGLVVVFAAGNSGGDGSGIRTSVWANIDDPGIVSVANFYDRRGWLDNTSSRGLRSLERVWPDLAAPGTQIISTSATAGPVTYVGTGQDAAINHLDENGEPDVISLPVAAVPVTLEENVGGQDVVVGPYASFTGTSMATPLVAGVAALVLEANPILTPAQVRVILRETANMVPGRSYGTDGFAIGKGVVDAAEAVAVALRMKDGDTLDAALRNAYVDTSGPVYKINETLPRRVVIDKPKAKQTRRRLTVEGRFIAGPVTDNSIPLLPPPPPAPPTIEGVPHIYQGNAIDPFVLKTDATVILPGEPVRLSVRSLHSNNGSIVVNATTATAKHQIMKNGILVYGPFDAVISADGTSQRSNYDWTVPVDAERGQYVFEAHVTVGAETYLAAALPFAIADVPASLTGASASASFAAPRVDHGLLTSGSTFYSEGFESGTDGWTIDNNGIPLTDWSVIDWDTSLLTWAGFHGEDGTNKKMFYAGDLATATAGISGLLYEEGANTDLISPVIDLSSATSATLEYWHAGMSEKGYHFLRAYVAEDGATPTWVKIDEQTGDFLNGAVETDWAASTIDLGIYTGKKIRLRFQFIATEIVVGTFHPMTLAGWYVDDIKITGETGTPVTQIVPTLSALPASGIGSLDTTFSFAAQANVPITGYSLDFGDGSPVHTATETGTVQHSYAAGQYLATLSVTDGSTTKTVSIPIDVAKVNEVQVRIGNGQWVDAGAASDSDTAWSVVFDLTGLSGTQTIEARHFDVYGNRVDDSITVNVS